MLEGLGEEGTSQEGVERDCFNKQERTIEVPSPFLETFARTCIAGGMDKEQQRASAFCAAFTDSCRR